MRCFIAIEISEVIKSELLEIEEELKKHGADVRWLKPDNIHLTLKFLGNIKEEIAGKISGIIEAICSHYDSFDLTVKGLGIFPNRKSPRVLWVGIEGNNILSTLQKEVDEGMSSIGLENEKSEFTAHLTLGRIRSSRGKEALLDAINQRKNDNFGSITVKSLSLIKSDLSPTGATYTKISEVSLGTSGS
ncbi:MAG: RNA 2',3'-cyclic phosphodiesterase [Thermodesulfovibrionia bacterium]|nr:RNA 2',3'-cyclic phosphodiesterase [Thermodesulfovibrionia bacterium]